jgi:guanylate kinase
MPGKLIILSGPSGVGKDTLIDGWIKMNPKVKRVVTCTTRQKRVNETEGLDYTFLSIEEFENRIGQGLFLEYKDVYGNYYGSPADQVQVDINNGHLAILKIDVQGALEVMKKRPDAVTIFIMPPSLPELERRIRGRATETDQALQKRLEQAKWEVDQAKHYQHQVVNYNIRKAIQALNQIINQLS